MEIKLRHFEKYLLSAVEVFKCGAGRTERFGWPERVKNEKVLHIVMEERKILGAVKRLSASWIDHILPRKCILRHIIQGQV